MSSQSKRLYALDGMRGVAALLVAIYHLDQRIAAVDLPGYLAVDLFFVISGYVIALNYQTRFEAGLRSFSFFKARFVRFYPLYFVGLLIGSSKQLVGHIAHDPRTMDLAEIFSSIFLGLLMIPSSITVSLYPLNNPSWSLFFELAINFAFATVMWKWPTKVIVLFALVCAILLAWNVSSPLFLNVGWSSSNALGGLFRSSFSFSTGVIIFRIYNSPPRRESWVVLFSIAVLCCTLLIDTTMFVRKLYELVAVFFVFPILVITAIHLDPPRFIGHLMKYLGDISFALYAVHYPLLSFILPIAVFMKAGDISIYFLYISFVMSFATIICRIDRRVQRKARSVLW